MRHVPLWKLKRELVRPFRQIAFFPERLATRLFGSAYYNLFLSRRVREYVGLLPEAEKVAVYLIFPTTGLLESHIAAIHYLHNSGYAPLVVSNLPLTGDERQRLLDICWRCIERPNFGYDFGGYRDGIMAAISRVPDLRRLVLVNDSCWFPLPESADWLAQAEAMDLDFVGAATNYGHPRVETTRYREIVWNYRTTHKNFLYCSFALMLSGNVLQDRNFLQFWKRFPLSKRKRLAVRRGEIGLSHWIMSHGYSHGTTHDISGLDAMLAGLSDQELDMTARGIIIPEARRLLTLKSHLLAEHPDRRDLEALIMTAVSNQGSSYVLTPFLHRHFGYAFLKKSPIWNDQEASDLTIALARRLEGPFAKTILQEALELRRNRAPSFNRIET